MKKINNVLDKGARIMGTERKREVTPDSSRGMARHKRQEGKKWVQATVSLAD